MKHVQDSEKEKRQTSNKDDVFFLLNISSSLLKRIHVHNDLFVLNISVNPAGEKTQVNIDITLKVPQF